MAGRDDWMDAGLAKVPAGGGGANGRHDPRRTVRDLVSEHLGAVEECAHAALLAMDLPPPSWLVEGLVCDEGLTWLGGKKKLGKSWMCLQVAQAVASGTACLGRAVSQGPVVCICLEDGRRRLKSRLVKQRAAADLPITWFTRFPAFDGDGLGMLMDLLAERAPRLLVVDTLAAAKTGKINENESGPMADLANALRVLGQVYKAGVLVTHHHGKLITGDPGDDLRGSSALGGAGDVNLGLYPESGGHVLRVEGRDVPDKSRVALKFDAEHTWAWQVREDGRADNGAPARERADLLAIEAVRQLGEASVSAIMVKLGLRDRKDVGARLRRLANEGLLYVRSAEPDGPGRPTLVYSVAEDLEASD